MRNYLTILIKIVLTLVWLAMATLALGHPMLMGLTTQASTRHSVFMVGFVVCMVLNILFVWRKPKASPSVNLEDRVLLAVTMICLCGLS
jgi:hypothetical protein